MSRWCGDLDRALADEGQRSACVQPARCLQRNDNRLKSRVTISIWINLVPTCMFTSRAESQSSAFSVLTVTFHSQMEHEHAAVVGVGEKERHGR